MTEISMRDPFEALKSGAESHEKAVSLRDAEKQASKHLDLLRMLRILEIPVNALDADIEVLKPGCVRVQEYVFIHDVAWTDGGVSRPQGDNAELIKMSIGIYYPHTSLGTGSMFHGPIQPLLTWVNDARTREDAQALVWGVMQQTKTIHETWVVHNNRLNSTRALIDDVVCHLIETLGKAYGFKDYGGVEDQSWF